MQSRNQILDDLARLITNTLGLAQNASGEMDNAIKSILDRYLVDRGLVTREEFDASQLMLQKTKNEVNELQNELIKIQEKLKEKGIRKISKWSPKIMIPSNKILKNKF